MNKKKGDQMQFFLQKRLEKKNGFIQPIISVDGLCYKNGIIDSTILLEIFSFVSNVYHATEKKQLK